MNADGVSTAAEMSSLAESGVSVIGLHSVEGNATDVMGNIQRRLGGYVKRDNSQGEVSKYLLIEIL